MEEPSGSRQLLTLVGSLITDTGSCSGRSAMAQLKPMVDARATLLPQISVTKKTAMLLAFCSDSG